MTNLRDRLVESDPLGQASALTPAEVEGMRQRVVAAHLQVRRPAWTPLLVLAAALLVTSAAGIELTRAAPIVQAPRRLRGDAGSSAIRLTQWPERRQLQFDTPGGTRVIWIFNTDFQDEGTR